MLRYFTCVVSRRSSTGPSSHRSAASPNRSLRIRSDALPASPAGSKVVSKLAGREDPAVDGSPAQPTALVLEADLEDASRTAVDGALYPYAPWSW